MKRGLPDYLYDLLVTGAHQPRAAQNDDGASAAVAASP